MKMFFGILIGLVLAGLIAVTAIKAAWGDIADVGERDRGADKTQTVAAADFDRISVTGVFELDVDVGPDYSLTLSGSEEDLAQTEVSVEDGLLVLDREEMRVKNRRRLVNHGVSAKVTMPAIRGIDVTGVVDGSIRGVDAEEFRADLSGVGDLKIAGTCTTLVAEVSGVGELDADELKCRNVRIDVSGIGGASVYASESVEADIAGIGKVDIEGSPANVSKSNSGPFGRISVK